MKNYLTKSRLLALVLILTLVCGTAVTASGAKRVKSKSVALDVTSVTLSVGDVATLDATMKPINTTDSLKWSSSNKNVATVNKYGAITAKAEGTATITVKTTSKKTAKCKVTVKTYLTKKNVQSLINGNAVSESKIIELIKANSLSESEVLTLIKNNSLSEEAVVKLIKDYASAEVDKHDWEDGTEIKLYEKQALPFKCSEDDTVLVVKSAHTKKYHYDAVNEAGQYRKYKVVTTFTGVVENKVDTYTEYISYQLTGTDFSCGAKVEINEDGTFTATGTSYTNTDHDEFVIQGIQ